MVRTRISVALIMTLLALGCGGGTPSGDPTGGGTGAVSPAPSPGGTEVDPDDPTILVRPFTAEQIRDEWVPGLRLLMRRTTPDATTVERWTVIAADDDGADIEYATIADDGTVNGEPPVEHSTWVELRDHATFPASQSTREWVARTTGLGEYEGWLYRVADDSADTVQEFFFVPELPGAPVQMRILKGGTAVFELEQTARLRPDTGGM
jgi:hypothetical protein